MNTPSADESNQAAPDDIAAFVEKLQKWAESLPEAEQPLAQFLVRRAGAIPPEHLHAMLAGGTSQEFVCSVRVYVRSAGG